MFSWVNFLRYFSFVLILVPFSIESYAREPSRSDFIALSDDDDDEVEIEGNVTRFVSITDFHVAGQSVTTDAQTRFEDGSGRNLRVGVRVEVEGSLNASGVLIAREIEFEDGDDDDNGDDRDEVEIEGNVTRFVSITDFHVAGQSVTTDAQTGFEDGSGRNLRVGVRVEVEGSLNASGVLVAREIEFDYGGYYDDDDDRDEIEIEGNVTRFVSATDFHVAGRPVTTDPWTRFEYGSAGNLRVGVRVEVEGHLNASGVLVAREIEFDDDGYDDDNDDFYDDDRYEVEIEGFVTRFVSISDFQVAGRPVTTNAWTRFEYGSVGNLRDGVRVEVEGYLNASGVLVAREIEFDDDDYYDDDDDRDEIEIEGWVTRFVSITDFQVAGRPVTTDGRTRFEYGSAGNLRDGVRVEVEGSLNASGVLVAREIEFDDDGYDDDDDRNEVEIEGYVRSFVSITDFQVAGRPVTTNAWTRFEDGAAGDLAVDVQVDVKGHLDAAGLLVAQQIEFDDDDSYDDDDDRDEIEIEGWVTRFVSISNFQVAGRPVTTDARTRFEDGSGRNLRDGVRVEVEGYLNAAGVLVAREIEFDDDNYDDDFGDDGNEVEIEGNVTRFVSATDFHVAGRPVTTDAWTRFEYGSVGNLRIGLRVEVEGYLNATGVLVAWEIEFDDDRYYDDDDRNEIEIEGWVTRFVSISDFQVAGRPVTTDAWTRFEDGSAGNLRDGVRVEVEGYLNASGVLVAREIEFDDDDYYDDDDDRNEVEIEGWVTRFVSILDFQVAGQPVTTDAWTRFEYGIAGDLAVGVRVEVEGYLNAAGVLVAREIEFEDYSNDGNDRGEAEIKGFVTSFISISDFHVARQPVTTDVLTRFDDGVATDLKLDVRVNVEGLLSPADVLVAREIEFTGGGNATSGELYDAWIRSFSSLPSTQRGFQDDPDLDDITNLVEYFYGLDPVSNSDQRVPLEVSRSSGLPQYIQLGFQRRTDFAARGISTIIQSSSDLDQWQIETGFLPEDNPVPTGNGITESVNLRADLSPNTPRRFYRLLILYTP